MTFWNRQSKCLLKNALCRSEPVTTLSKSTADLTFNTQAGRQAIKGSILPFVTRNANAWQGSFQSPTREDVVLTDLERMAGKLQTSRHDDSLDFWSLRWIENAMHRDWQMEFCILGLRSIESYRLNSAFRMQHSRSIVVCAQIEF